uniref:MADF domain-containing protein n=1 Tax=Heterorhabditis bacteriophora TaxID=37862 RepID=A0A1I7XQF0_HETBA
MSLWFPVRPFSRIADEFFREFDRLDRGINPYWRDVGAPSSKRNIPIQIFWNKLLSKFLSIYGRAVGTKKEAGWRVA